MSLNTSVSRQADGTVKLAFASGAQKRQGRKAGKKVGQKNRKKEGLAAWEQKLLGNLLHLMEDAVPGQVREKPLLKKRVEEVFEVIFDMASREKPSGGGTDGRKKDRPSKFGPKAAELKRACIEAMTQAHLRTWGKVKTALMSWQQSFLEQVIDEIDETVPGGLKGILDKRTWFRVNKVMDLAVEQMRKVKPKSHKQFKRRNNMASFGDLARSKKTAKLRTALSKWQQDLLEGLMDLVDELVPGGQMNAPRIWFRINEVMDLVWKISPAKKKGKKAAVGNFQFETNSYRAAIMMKQALTHWQSAFLERLVMLFEDLKINWPSQKKKVEEVFDMAFRMVAEGDKIHKQTPKGTPEGMRRTQPNQHGRGKFTKNKK